MKGPSTPLEAARREAPSPDWLRLERSAGAWISTLSQHWRTPCGVLAAAVLYALACPPYECAAAAWLVPGVLLRTVRRQRPLRALASGLLFALLFGYGMTSWAVGASLDYFGLSQVRAWALAAAVWLACGLPYALLTAAYAATWRRVHPAARAPWAGWLWIGAELLRASLFGGMPWELLGHTQFRHLWLIQIADLGGVYAVSFVVVLCSVAAVDLLLDSRRAAAEEKVSARWVLPAAALAATLLYGWSVRHALAGEQGAGEARTVAVVQGNVPNSLRWKRAHFERTLAAYAKLTLDLRAPRPDFVVWPENAVNFYLAQEPALGMQVALLARQVGEGLVFGGPRLGDDHANIHNSAYLMGAEGKIRGTYDKRKLVPFAEYDPFATPTAQQPAYAPGGAPRLLQTSRTAIGASICYEILFPGLIRDLVRAGATLLFNISNDSWMDVGDGVAPRQHFSMAVFRAVETRRFLVRASSGGFSGFVSPLGEMFADLPDQQAGTAIATVRLRSDLTPYVRWGDLWAVFGVLGACASLVPTRRPA